jgi:hypothetical protein
MYQNYHFIVMLSQMLQHVSAHQLHYQGVHTICRSHAVPQPCHEYAVLKATTQGHGTARHGNGIVCVN